MKYSHVTYSFSFSTSTCYASCTPQVHNTCSLYTSQSAKPKYSASRNAYLAVHRYRMIQPASLLGQTVNVKKQITYVPSVQVPNKSRRPEVNPYVWFTAPQFLVFRTCGCITSVIWNQNLVHLNYRIIWLSNIMACLV